jgi:molybdate/tungstate transport system substrate-binding protein
MAMLVVPGVRRGGRYVSNIRSIELLRAQGGSMSAEPASLEPVRAYHAGSLNAVIDQQIGPGFTAASGYPFEHTGGPSVGLANRIRSGEITPDVYLSADAEVNQVLMGADKGDHVRWYFTMARTRTVIAYSPLSRFKADLDAAAAGTRPWYEVLQTPGLVFKRNDPRTDPGGYRAVFLFDLAERHYGVPGLKQAILQGDDNEAQILGWSYASLKEGSVDAAATYVTNALENGLPYVQLPDEVDQSNLAMGELYATAIYTNPQGQTFRGTPSAYSVTIPRRAANPAAAEEFVRYLLSDPGRAALAGRGFLPSEILVGGDERAVPDSLRGLIAGRYNP